MIGKMRILPTVSPPLRWGRLRGGTCQLVSFLTCQLKEKVERGQWIEDRIENKK